MNTRIMSMKIKVIITAKSAKNKICRLVDSDELRIRITEAPEKGKANKALCAFLGKKLGVPKSSVKVIKGKTSRYKTVEVPVDVLPESIK
ncbi:MAG: DUF167 domain-containing protein [Eggerthellaceae bacterium]|nr:DUF167 domain-containing protein [Eggerthellaceae bacterium]